MVGGIIGDAENRDANEVNLRITHSINVVDDIHVSGNGSGGVIGYYLEYGSLSLNNLYNYIKYINLDSDVNEFGGVIGRISFDQCDTSTLDRVYNVIDKVMLGKNAYFSGLVGVYQYFIAMSNEENIYDESELIKDVSSYVKSVNAVSNERVYKIAGVLGKISLTNNSKIKLSTISNVSSYLNCSEANCTGGVIQIEDAHKETEYLLNINNSSIGASNSNNQCYNVITSDKYSDRVEFENTYWFSPDSEHYAPFGKDVSYDASKLTAFGDNANEISEVADSIKVWEPATEQIELGGKSFELPVVFTKEQFLQETGLTYDQSRYTDFDNWCRRVEQEHPELLDEIE